MTDDPFVARRSPLFTVAYETLGSAGRRRGSLGLRTEITPVQARILTVLEAELEGASDSRVALRTEWIGWIVDPVASYVEVDGEDVSARFPRGWNAQDLEVLAASGGRVRGLGGWQNPEDAYDRIVYYEVSGQP